MRCSSTTAPWMSTWVSGSSPGWGHGECIAYEPAVAALIAYLSEEVLPHAVAEEHTSYRVAGARADRADTVNEMTAEHRVLTSATESLANAATAPAALEQAKQIGTLFTVHVNKENDLLLPVLLEDDGVGVDVLNDLVRFIGHLPAFPRL